MFALNVRVLEFIIDFADLDLLKEVAEIIETHPEQTIIGRGIANLEF